MSSFIVYVASRYGRNERPDFATRVAEAKIACAKNVLTWPTVAPVFEKGESADKLRRARYFAALTDANGIMDDAAARVARGERMRVWIGTGVCLTSDKDNKVFANVVAPADLSELCHAADEVKVSAGSEDPRDFEPTTETDLVDDSDETF